MDKKMHYAGVYLTSFSCVKERIDANQSPARIVMQQNIAA